MSKARGWRRIGIVLSIMCFVGLFLAAWWHVDDEATSIFNRSASICYHRWGSSDSLELDMSKYRVCFDQASDELLTNLREVRNFRTAALITAINLILIGLGWLIVWGIVGTMHWIARGFA